MSGHVALEDLDWHEDAVATIAGIAQAPGVHDRRRPQPRDAQTSVLAAANAWPGMLACGGIWSWMSGSQLRGSASAKERRAQNLDALQTQ